MSLLLALVASQVLWLLYNGAAVARPTIPRGIQKTGNGAVLRYVVLGDSTSVAQGGEYEQGYAAQTAVYLGLTHSVQWQNVGVSGARARDVLKRQIPAVKIAQPDVVLIGVGANDVTHGTRVAEVYDSLTTVVAHFKRANPDVLIILTGSPDMGSPRRIPQPLRWLAGERTKTLNNNLQSLIDNKTVFLAPIAERTGPAFRADATLFAADNFHPTTEGYRLWTAVIIDTLKHAGL